MKHIDTIILVKDINKSKQFYMDNFQLEILHDWKSMIVFSNRLALHQADLLQPQERVKQVLKPDNLGAGNVIIYLETKKLEADYVRLMNLGCEIVHEIIELPWGKIFRLKDIDGHILEIGEEKDLPA